MFDQLHGKKGGSPAEGLERSKTANEQINFSRASDLLNPLWVILPIALPSIAVPSMMISPGDGRKIRNKRSRKARWMKRLAVFTSEHNRHLPDLPKKWRSGISGRALSENANSQLAFLFLSIFTLCIISAFLALAFWTPGQTESHTVWWTDPKNLQYVL